MSDALPTDAPVFIAGHGGLVGSALVRCLRRHGFTNLLMATHAQLELRDPGAVDAWFAKYRPEYVIHAAGTVGGILDNATRPAEFLYDNLMVHATVLRAAWKHGVAKLLYLGSSCIYPRDCPQPIRESSILTGPLEPTNEAYAIAKITGVKACQAYRAQYGCRFISAMPTNLYGPGDHFNLPAAHVLPALMRKFHQAKIAGELEVVVWGTGKPRREFLHVDDLADACLCLLEQYDDASPINIGCGTDTSIRELAELVREIVHPEAKIIFDTSRPDGTPRKLLDVSRLSRLGWAPRIPLEEGLRATYAWFCNSESRE